jgi:thioredoxin-dependent peroxiredoxin
VTQRVPLAVIAIALAAGTSILRAQCVPAQAGPGRPLQIGDPAPAFSLPGSDGRYYRLSDYRGKRAVVLAWFAKAFTGG